MRLLQAKVLKDTASVAWAGYEPSRLHVSGGVVPLHVSWVDSTAVTVDVIIKTCAAYLLSSLVPH